MLKRVLLLAAAAGIAFAQTESITSAAATATGSAAPSSTGATNTTNAPITHTVSVGYGGNTFVPDVTLANPGDVVEFDFYPNNHSVIRAEYGYPCIPYEDTGVDKIGFFSGFKPVDAIINDPPKWSITINDTKPVFYYCGASGSCINYGMVGVINPNATTSVVTQKQKAESSTYMLLPGEAFPSEDGDGDGSTYGTASSTSSTPAQTSHAAATSSAAAAASSSHSSGLSAGAIAGISIGAAAIALAAAVLLYFCGRQSLQGRHAPHPQQVPFQPGHGHMSYIDPQKHMSMQSSVGPALPGYAPSEQAYSMHSPPLQAYTPSDALNPGNPSSPGASPQNPAAVPAYSRNSTQSTPHQSMYGAPAATQQPMPGIHEMAAPVPEESPQGGIMGFLRNSSVRNSDSKGGVERYS